jgi:hypothetical protein
VAWVKSASKTRSAYGVALDELRGFGFDAPGKPVNPVPLLPEDLGDLSDRILMQMFNELTQWANYAAFLVTRAEVKEEEAEASLRVAEAKYIVLNVGKGEAGIQRANKERDIDTEVIGLREKVLQAKALRKMLITVFTNIDRSMFVVSRDLSRRIGLAKPQGRQQWTAP